MRLVLVLIGGALGSAARYLAVTAFVDRFGPAFPWGTLTVNITGSFLIGLVAALADDAGAIGPDARLFLITGVLGGFTTFSAFSLETLRLLETHQHTRAAAYVLASVTISLAAAALGLAAGRGIAR
jgi:fluoride exporter